MPLSDEEQRILSEIERQLSESDPQLVREVEQTTLFTESFRNLKFATLGFVVGAIIMIATLQAGFLYAFVGFLVMLGSALVFERNARRLGRAGMEEITQGMRPSPLRGAGSRWRDRMPRRDRDPDKTDEPES